MSRAGLGFAALLFAAPFFIPVHPAPVGSFWAESLAIALGLAAIGCAYCAPSRLRATLPAIFYGLLGLAGVLALQIALGMVAFPSRSLVGIGMMLWAAALVATGVRLREALGLETVARVLAIALAVAGFCAAIIGLMQVGQVRAFGVTIGPADMVGLMGQRNHMANLIACGLVSAGYLAIVVPHRTIMLLAAVPMVLALILNGSRSVWAYGTLALLVAILCAQQRRGEWRLNRTAIAGLVMLAAGALAFLMLGTASGGRLVETLAGGGIHDPRREVMAAYALAVFQHAPLLGVGWGELAFASFALAPAVGLPLAGVVDAHAHNLFLQLAAETGVIGVTLISLALASALVRLPWSAMSPAYGWLTALVLIQLFHGQVEYPQWYAYFLGPLALLLGIGHEGGETIRQKRETIRPKCETTAFAGEARRGICIMGMQILRAWMVVTAAWALGLVALQVAQLQDWQREVAAAGRGPLKTKQFERLFQLSESHLGWRLQPAIAMYAVAGNPEQTAAALAITTRAMHAHPVPELAEHLARLLDSAGRGPEAARIREAAAVAVRPSR